MTITPEQWDLAKLHIWLAGAALEDGHWESKRKVALGHLDIARQALNPVTDEERAG
jgi:hypothetical protein